MTGPMPNPLPPRPPAPQDIRIGLWGAPGSGKTTYLASLDVATTRWRGPGHWIMNGLDAESSDFLTTSTDLLVRQQLFPLPNEGNRNLLFRFNGTTPEPARRKPLFGKAQPQGDQHMAFELDLLDVPGGLFDNSQVDTSAQPSGNVDASEGRIDTDDSDGDNRADDAEQLIEHLEDCHGIVYLFDPVRDAEKGDAFRYFHKTLEQLTQRCFDKPHYQGGHLPHFLAVCVTKFDHPEVYRVARRLGLTVQDDYPPHLPSVPNEYAGEFFHQLCHASARTTADLVYGSLINHFHRDKVKVFVTSSIGFYIGDGRRFRPHDCGNVEGTNNGHAKIKGPVHPINVLEPVIWLQQEIRKAGIR